MKGEKGEKREKLIRGRIKIKSQSRGKKKFLPILRYSTFTTQGKNIIWKKGDGWEKINIFFFMGGIYYIPLALAINVLPDILYTPGPGHNCITCQLRNKLSFCNSIMGPSNSLQNIQILIKQGNNKKIFLHFTKMLKINIVKTEDIYLQKNTKRYLHIKNVQHDKQVYVHVHYTGKTKIQKTQQVCKKEVRNSQHEIFKLEQKTIHGFDYTTLSY